MNAKPKYEIICTTPIYCSITDGLIGSRSFTIGRPHAGAAS